MTAVLSVVSGKWKFLILWYIYQFEGIRYGKLKEHMQDISLKVYNDQLKELIEDEMVVKRTFAEVPPRTEYYLTPYGKTIVPALQLLMEWGLEHIKKKPEIIEDPEIVKKIFSYFENRECQTQP